MTASMRGFAIDIESRLDKSYKEADTQLSSGSARWASTSSAPSLFTDPDKPDQKFNVTLRQESAKQLIAMKNQENGEPKEEPIYCDVSPKVSEKNLINDEIFGEEFEKIANPSVT